MGLARHRQAETEFGWNRIAHEAIEVYAATKNSFATKYQQN